MTEGNQNGAGGGSSDEVPATVARDHNATASGPATGPDQGHQPSVATAISGALRSTTAGSAASHITAATLPDALTKHRRALADFQLPAPQFDLGHRAAAHRGAAQRLIGDAALKPQNLLGNEVLKNLGLLQGLSPARVTPQVSDHLPRSTSESIRHIHAAVAEHRQVVISHLRSAATFRSSMAHTLNVEVPRIDLSAYTSVMSSVASAQAAVQQNLADLTRGVDAVSSMRRADLHTDAINGFVSTVRGMQSLRAGLARDIVPAVNAIGLMHTNVMSAVESLRNTLGPLAGTAKMRGLTPALNVAGSLRGAVVPTLSSMISELMRGWNVLSGLGHQLANWALLQARRVRRELLRNPDRQAVRAAITWFMREVLHYKWIQGDDHIDAAIAALLDDSWLPGNVYAWPQESDTREQLRQLTNKQHRLWRPIGETQLQRRTVTSLDAPLSAHGDSDSDIPYTEADRVRAVDFFPAQIPVSDPRLQRMFEHLSPVEQEIVLAKYGEGCTWAEAAVSCGRLPGDGEKLRRKFRRLTNIELQSLPA